jgi:NCS1 family nucleobase:cation symporter-1
VIYGKAIWDPVQVIERFENPVILFFAMIVIGIATLSTNVAANVVSPANDFANMIPAKISFKRGGLITAFIGILIMPWKLIADPSGYIFTWLIGYSSLLGPIGGILLVDYFILRKQQLDVDGLYQLESPYYYTGGINLKAVAAFVIGVLPNIPGFLNRVGALSQIHPLFETIYSFAWFVGLPLAGLTYYLLMTKISK